MGFRTGLIAGLAVGYYYGTRAGRERHEQIQAWFERIRSTTTVQEARTKASDLVREGSVVAWRLIEDATSGDRQSPGSPARPAPDPEAPLVGDPALG
jgi:hypothetical protein